MTKRILFFLLFSFSWSWIFWHIGSDVLEGELNYEKISSYLPWFFTGIYGPTLGALVTSLIFDGIRSVKELLLRLLKFRFPFSMYLFIILIPIVLTGTALALYSLAGNNAGALNVQAYTAIPLVIITGSYAGPLGEELGWRGWLLPVLQTRFTPLQSSLYIGVIWFLWHIPLFSAPFGTLISGAPLEIVPTLSYFFILVSLSIMMTWVCNRSEGSVFSAFLFHLMINAGIVLLFFPELGQESIKVHLWSVLPSIFLAISLVLKDKMYRGKVLEGL